MAMKILKVLGGETTAYVFLAFCLGMLAIPTLIKCTGFHIVDDNDFERIQLQECTQDLNNKYYEYYKSTEQLLDEILDEDDPILESDCGAKYLDNLAKLRKAIGRK
jgi:hypothetical protein